MFRLFLALNFLLLNIYACKGGFDSCILKVKDSASIKNDMLQIPIKNNKLLIFSEKTPNLKIIKHDPYLSLYLVEDKNRFKHPFRINTKLSLGTALIDNSSATEGKIQKHQIGLNNFATYNEKLSYPAILTNSCCALEGIVTSKGIIEKEYISRFLDVEKVSYSDIGIRLEDINSNVVVNASNPFMDGNHFKVNDVVLEFDGIKVESASSLMRKILFSKIGSSHRVKIKRDSKVFELHVESQKRDGGGYLSDTFLEFLGLSFDRNLYITNIDKKANKYQLKVGDRLISINNHSIKTESEILSILTGSKDESKLLFQRGNFQFFITVNNQ